MYFRQIKKSNKIKSCNKQYTLPNFILPNTILNYPTPILNIIIPCNMQYQTSTTNYDVLKIIAINRANKSQKQLPTNKSRVYVCTTKHVIKQVIQYQQQRKKNKRDNRNKYDIKPAHFTYINKDLYLQLIRYIDMQVIVALKSQRHFSTNMKINQLCQYAFLFQTHSHKSATSALKKTLKQQHFFKYSQFQHFENQDQNLRKKINNTNTLIFLFAVIIFLILFSNIVYKMHYIYIYNVKCGQI
eukprot:TRINITY_DN7289_c0_g1_i10.p1 TRINITY_DN7289_c0_g1~~TRINITY_DN7289_c0_g1_i10.p1  ORF type:complete len:243 (-),score=-34.70 TRINITY_DN7289_c0_g1_i10:2-730(-)